MFHNMSVTGRPSIRFVYQMVRLGNIPTYYLNRLIRVAYLSETNTAVFSDDIVSAIPLETTQQSDSSVSIIRHR